MSLLWTSPASSQRPARISRIAQGYVARFLSFIFIALLAGLSLASWIRIGYGTIFAAFSFFLDTYYGLGFGYDRIISFLHIYHKLHTYYTYSLGYGFDCIHGYILLYSTCLHSRYNWNLIRITSLNMALRRFLSIQSQLIQL